MDEITTRRKGFLHEFLKSHLTDWHNNPPDSVHTDWRLGLPMTIVCGWSYPSGGSASRSWHTWYPPSTNSGDYALTTGQHKENTVMITVTAWLLRQNAAGMAEFNEYEPQLLAAVNNLTVGRAFVYFYSNGAYETKEGWPQVVDGVLVNPKGW